MRGLGQIAALCAIARPTIVVVPHIGPEHLELLGTVERVAEANAEAIAALPSGGTAVVPARGARSIRTSTRDDITIRRFDPATSQQRDAVTRFSVGRRDRRARAAVHAAPPRRRTRSPRSTPTTRSGSRSIGRPKASPASCCRRGAARSSRCRAAGSSSTTPTTRTPTRCGPRSSISRSAPASAGRSRSSGRWPSSATTLRALPPRDRRARRRARDRRSSAWARPSRAYEPVAWAADAAAAVDDARALRRPGGRRPREGLARRRARRHRRRDHELRPSMVPVLIAGLIAMVAAVVIGPKFIELLRDAEPRPADPRRGSGDPRREAGHADDGRAPDPRVGGRPVPRSSRSTRPRG